MTNRELLDALEAYYLSQDPKRVARCLANAALDLHRTHIKAQLDHNQRFNLEVRLELMSNSLVRFMRAEEQGKPHTPLTIQVMNSGD